MGRYTNDDEDGDAATIQEADIEDLGGFQDDAPDAAEADGDGIQDQVPDADEADGYDEQPDSPASCTTTTQVRRSARLARSCPPGVQGSVMVESQALGSMVIGGRRRSARLRCLN